MVQPQHVIWIKCKTQLFARLFEQCVRSGDEVLIFDDMGVGSCQEEIAEFEVSPAEFFDVGADGIPGVDFAEILVSDFIEFTQGYFRARSTSHSVAVRDGCTNIPHAAGKGSGRREPFSTAAFQALGCIGSSTWIRWD